MKKAALLIFTIAIVLSMNAYSYTSDQVADALFKYRYVQPARVIFEAARGGGLLKL